jgi:hypothetical protein
MHVAPLPNLYNHQFISSKRSYHTSYTSYTYLFPLETFIFLSAGTRKSSDDKPSTTEDELPLTWSSWHCDTNSLYGSEGVMNLQIPTNTPIGFGGYL